MTAKVDFTRQAFFRDPAAGTTRLRAMGPVVADPVSHRQQGLDHDDARREGARPDGQRDVHDAKGGRARVRHYGA